MVPYFVVLIYFGYGFIRLRWSVLWCFGALLVLLDYDLLKVLVGDCLMRLPVTVILDVCLLFWLYFDVSGGCCHLLWLFFGLVKFVFAV